MSNELTNEQLRELARSTAAKFTASQGYQFQTLFARAVIAADRARGVPDGLQIDRSFRWDGENSRHVHTLLMKLDVAAMLAAAPPTAQPERKPMTTTDILRAYRKSPLLTTIETFTSYIRIVEAFHGIGVKP